MTPTETHDLVVIGAGPAGMAAAISAKRAGINDVLVLERDEVAGGVLNQCIHDGFGLVLFETSLSGPEFAEELIEDMKKEEIQVLTSAMVINITGDRIIRVNTEDGYRIINARAIIMAMGCRERTRDALGIPGSRPAGIYSAGCAQNLVNLQNLKIGRDILILGSGDIGLIMARRLSIEGMNVLGVHEVMPYCGGLERNLRHCLNDFGIPLHLSSTVVSIHGEDRLEHVVVADVDKNRKPIPGTEQTIKCDTLLLSVGLIPENELSKNAGIDIDPASGGAVVSEQFMTSVPGIFACGNVLHIHDIADYASIEGTQVGEAVAAFILQKLPGKPFFHVEAGEGIRYCIPQKIAHGTPTAELSVRVQLPGTDVKIVAEGLSTGKTFNEYRIEEASPSIELKVQLNGPFNENIRIRSYV